MGKGRKFGELELAVLEAIRAHPGISVREVLQWVAGEYTTIMTVMNRLVAKGALKREKSGKRYLYWIATLPKGGNLLNKLKQRVFGGRLLPMVRALVEAEEVSAEELEEIEKLIAKAKKERK